MYCSQCGTSNADSARFCQACGARLRPGAEEAVSVPGETATGAVFAGFWRRLAAWIIDAILTWFITWVLSFVLFIVDIFVDLGLDVVQFLPGLAIAWVYWAVMESSSYQATLGKQAVGIVVTDLSGRRISFWRATGRHFAKYISALILLIGFIMIGFTEKKQGLHDMMAGTLVVMKK